MILHIPHSSDLMPEEFRDQIILSNDELAKELLLMTDSFTDELFGSPEASIVRFPISRLLVDVERFSEDAEEPMSKVGMGMIYTKTAHGKNLKRDLEANEKEELFEYYQKHHEELTNAVNKELKQNGKAVIIDCHSFPSNPLPCDVNQETPRPDFCIGTDSFHTPSELTEILGNNIKNKGYSLGINIPYEGTIVPMDYYRKDSRVISIMIEVNRNLYMDEQSGMKIESFEVVLENIQSNLNYITDFFYSASM